jgi:hypothetical protein
MASRWGESLIISTRERLARRFGFAVRSLEPVALKD